MTIGDKLKQRRKEIGLSMKEVAEKIGVAEATVSRWESGDIANMKRNYIMEYAKALQVSPLYIMGYDEYREEKKAAMRKYIDAFEEAWKGSRTVKIPVFSYVSAGTGTYADESNIDCYIDISEDIAKTGDYFGVRVKGDSMQPDIHDQDIVIVKSQNTANDGDTVVAVVNGDEGFCKKLMLYPNSIGLVSNNPAYRPMIFTQKEVEDIPVRIMGVVVELRRSFSR